MAFESRQEGLTETEAAVVEDELRQLGAVDIRRITEAGGKFTVVGTFPGSPFATSTRAEVEAHVPPTSSTVPAQVSRTTSFDVIAPEYRLCFDACTPVQNRAGAIAAQVAAIRSGEARYRALGARLGIPWFFIGIIHSLECSCRFDLHLHNGDPLTDRTKRVPAGRPIHGAPPFSWEESAEDALRMKGYVGLADWSTASMLFRWESYNGMGYRTQGLPSPYLWSFSNLYQGGLFVDDHVFDPHAVSRQCGAAVLLKALQGTA
jgi:lysozyme family protein